MLGSDYPFPLGESHPGQLIESMQHLSSNVKVRLLRAVAFIPVSITSAATDSDVVLPKRLRFDF